MRLKLKNTHYILCDGCNLNDWFRRADNSNFIGSDQGSFNGMISGHTMSVINIFVRNHFMEQRKKKVLFLLRFCDTACNAREN